MDKSPEQLRGIQQLLRLSGHRSQVTRKACTDVASNLLAIELRLDVPIARDGLQQKFQHVEYCICDPLIS